MAELGNWITGYNRVSADVWLGISHAAMPKIFGNAFFLIAKSFYAPSQSYVNGSYDMYLYNLPPNAAGARVILSRQDMNNLTGNIAIVTMYQSDNGGASWDVVKQTTLSGGTAVRDNGETMTESGVSFQWSGEDVEGTRVKKKGTDIRITCQMLQTCTTAVHIDSIGEKP